MQHKHSPKPLIRRPCGPVNSFFKKMHVLTPNFPYSAPFPSILASRPHKKEKGLSPSLLKLSLAFLLLF